MGTKVASPVFTEEEKKEVQKKLLEQGPEKTAEDIYEMLTQIMGGMRQIVEYIESSAYHCALVNIAKMSCSLTLSACGVGFANYGFETGEEDGDGE